MKGMPMKIAKCLVADGLAALWYDKITENLPKVILRKPSFSHSALNWRTVYSVVDGRLLRWYGWALFSNQSYHSCPYASKWERRLRTLLEPRRYAPPPPPEEVAEGEEILLDAVQNVGTKSIIGKYRKDGINYSERNDNIHNHYSPILYSKQNSNNNNRNSNSLVTNSGGDQLHRQHDTVTVEAIRPIWSSRRIGLLAYKVGCMSLWDDWGERHAVTVCCADRCVVLEPRTVAKHGYSGVQLGLGFGGPDLDGGHTGVRAALSRNNLGRAIALGIEPKAHVAEFKCSPDCILPARFRLSVRHFTPGQWVFVSGFARARGFQGAVRRWGFAGASASHGTESKAHRALGATSQGHSVNVVWRGKKMAGHMGGDDPRVCNCRVMRIEAARDLIFLRGAVPGAKGDVIKISDARGRTAHRNRKLYLHYPTFIPEPGRAYPRTVNAPPSPCDPFLYADIPLYDDPKKQVH